MQRHRVACRPRVITQLQLTRDCSPLTRDYSPATAQSSRTPQRSAHPRASANTRYQTSPSAELRY
eukprot:2900461-Rhodomonas_salina.3